MILIAYSGHCDNKYKTDADSKANSLNASLKALIPSYKDNNWKKLNLSMEESTGNKYAVDYINEEYVLSWVKVTLNGNVQKNGFDSEYIDDLDYYTNKVETRLNGDKNNTGYYFDYVYSKGGIYLVNKYDK